MTPEEKQKFNDAINAYRMSPETAYELSQNISKARKQQEGLPLFGNGKAGNFFGGVGSSFLRGGADALGFLNFNSAENLLNSGADWIDERLPPPMDAEFSWKYFTSPNGIWRGSGNLGGSVLSIALPSGVGALTMGSKINKLAKGISSLTRGKVGLDTAKALTYGAPTVPMESAMEGNMAGNEALARGLNQEEADDVARGVFGRNMAILGLSNLGQWGLLPKLAGRGTSVKGRLGAGATELATQLYEEFLQEGAKNAALGEPYTYNPANIGNPKYGEQNQAALAGFIDMAPLTALGGVVGYGRNKIKTHKEYEQAAPKLRDWAKDISGNEKSDEVIDLILKNAKKLNYTPEQTKLALSLATAESNLNQNARSDAGAIGVMQLMPENARSLGVNPENLEENIYGGMKYLKQQLEEFDGDWKKAAAAYNAGPGAVQKYGGVPPYSETQRYVSRIGGFLADSPQYNGEGYEYSSRETNVENIFGVESYEMPTQGDNITEQVTKLKGGWEKVIPQIGGALKNKFGLTPVISSAARTKEHNAEVGGSKTSHHIIREDGGDALDIVFNEDTTAEQQQQIADYFKGTGLFREVLYHDVGSGAHLHLGGLNVEALQPKANGISGVSDESDNETSEERSPMVDEILKTLLGNNVEPKFNIEKQTPLTRATYEDFVFNKLYEDTSEEADFNKDFFSKHAELFDKDGKFVNNENNRKTVTEYFGEEEIKDFGQRHVAERLAAVRNIQTPNDIINFKLNDFTDKNSGETMYGVELKNTLPNNIYAEVEKLAQEYGGKRGSKGKYFNFKNAEDRNAFAVDAERTVQHQKQKPKNADQIEELLQQENGTTFNPSQVNPVTKNIFNKFAQEKYQNRNTDEGREEFKQNFKGMFKDGSFINSIKNRARLAEIYQDELQTFGQNELNRQISDYQNWRQQSTAPVQSVQPSEIVEPQQDAAPIQEELQPVKIENPADSLRSQIKSVQNTIAEFKPQYNEVSRLIDNQANISEDEQNFQNKFDEIKQFGQYLNNWNNDLLRHTKEYNRLKELESSGELDTYGEQFIKTFEDSYLEGQKNLQEFQRRQQELQQLNQRIEDQRKPYYDLSRKIMTPDAEQFSPQSQFENNSGNLFSEDFINAQNLQTLKDIKAGKITPAEYAERNRTSAEKTRQQYYDLSRKIMTPDTEQAPPQIQSNNVADNSTNNQFTAGLQNLNFLSDMNVGMRPISEKNKNLIQQQAKALLNVINNPNLEKMLGRKIEVPQEIKTSLAQNNLKDNQIKAIQTAQELLRSATGIKNQKNEEPNKKPKKISGLNGKFSTFTTDNGKEYGFRYRVVESNDLITSHEISGNNTITNGKYPQELQPRDREERVALNLQVLQMAEKLNPNDLLESRNVNQGAPVIREDGIVLNGNARAMSINQAYKIGKAKNYRDSIIANAEKLEFKRAEVEKMKQPVLVREVVNSLNENDISEIINSKAGGSDFSATEKSKIDAQKISRASLEQYVENDNGDLNLDKSENKNFVTSVIGEIVTQNELNAYVDKNGKINSDGLNRIKRALFAKAYEDNDLIARMAESTEDNVKNLTSALASVSPTIARLKIRMNKGELYNYDVSKNITDAVQTLSELRDSGKTFDDYLNQSKLFNQDAPEMQEILKFFDANKNSKATISKFLRGIITGIEAQGKPDDEAAFDFGDEFKKAPAAPLLDIIQTAKEKAVVENPQPKKAADKGERDTSMAEKQKGALILDRSASLSSVSNDEPAQNGNASENVGTDAQSATENSNALMDTSNVSDKNITQSTANDKLESESAKNNFKSKETKSPKTGAVTFESKIKTNLPSKVFSEVKKMAKKYGATLSKEKENTFRFKDEESRAKFEEESNNYIQNAKAQTENLKPTENISPVQSDGNTSAVAENEQPKITRTGKKIFGNIEDNFREGLEAFGMVDTSSKENKLPEDKFVNVFDDSEENIQRLKAKWDKRKSQLSSNPMFDPELWTTALELGGIYIQRGINKFADWAKQITKTLGKDSEDWQPAIWEMLKTMPKIDKFNDKQISAIAKIVGSLYEDGTVNFKDIRTAFDKNFGLDKTNEIEPLIKATYNGIQKFFETLDAKNKKSANEEKNNLSNEKDTESKADAILKKLKLKPMSVDSGYITNISIMNDLSSSGYYGSPYRVFLGYNDSKKAWNILDRIAEATNAKIVSFDQRQHKYGFKKLEDARVFAKATQKVFLSLRDYRIEISEDLPTVEEMREREKETKEAQRLAEEKLSAYRKIGKPINDIENDTVTIKLERGGERYIFPKVKTQDKTWFFYPFESAFYDDKTQDMYSPADAPLENALWYFYNYGNAEKAIQAIEYDIKYTRPLSIKEFEESKKILKEQGENWQAIPPKTTDEYLDYYGTEDEEEYEGEDDTAGITEKTSTTKRNTNKTKTKKVTPKQYAEQIVKANITTYEEAYDELQNEWDKYKRGEVDIKEATRVAKSVRDYVEDVVRIKDTHGQRTLDSFVKIFEDEKDTVATSPTTNAKNNSNSENDTDKNKSQQQITEVQFESEELDKIFEDLETYYGNTKDIEKLSKRLKKTAKEPPIEMTDDLIKSTQKENNVSEDEAKEIIADSILNRLENNVRDYIEAAEKFNYFDENYNQPDSAVDSSERQTVEKIAESLYGIKKLFQSKMEDTLDNLDAALAQIKNPSKKLTERHKKIMRDFQVFEGLVTEDSEQEKADEIKKSANNDEQEITSNKGENHEHTVTDSDLPNGYRTESGRNLQDADSSEFILKSDGSKDFGRISEEIAEKANEGIRKEGLEGKVKSLPVRLQVGIPDIGEEDGFGFIHALPHINQIRDKGFENIPSYIEHILKNFSQIYKAGNSNRIILYCKGDKSKGLMPIDLEVEKDSQNEFYTVVTAYPRRRANTKRDTLILDTHPTNVSTDATTVLYDPESNNNSGITSRSGYTEENVSPTGNISQATENNNKNLTSEKINPILKIGEFRHTKTGKLLPSVEMTERLDNEVYVQLKNLAKKYGGSYSKFAKKFLFNKNEGRDKFIEEANRDILKAPKTEAPKQSAESSNSNTEQQNIFPKYVYTRIYKNGNTQEVVEISTKGEKPNTTFKRKVTNLSNQFGGFKVEDSGSWRYVFHNKNAQAFKDALDTYIEPVRIAMENKEAEIDNRVLETLKAAGLENKKPPVRFHINAVKNNTVRIRFSEKDESFTDDLNSVAYKLDYDLIDVDGNLIEYRFNNEDDAEVFKKVLEIYNNNKTNNELKPEEVSAEKADETENQSTKTGNNEAKAKTQFANEAGLTDERSPYNFTVTTEGEKVRVAGKNLDDNFFEEIIWEIIPSEDLNIIYESNISDSEKIPTHEYLFTDKEGAKIFAKALEVYRGSSNENETENLAREALKAAGLEGKVVDTNFTTELRINVVLVKQKNPPFEEIEKIDGGIAKLMKFFNAETSSRYLNEDDICYALNCYNLKDAPVLKKALDIYLGANENEQRELGTRRGTDEGHSIQQSEVRETTDEGTRQTGRDKVSEEVSGQERHEISGTERNDTEPNAASDRSNAKNDTGESSARNSAGNGLRRSESTVHAATDAGRGNSGLSENVSKLEFAGHNFKITDNSEIGSGGLKEKFKQNIAAVKLLKQLESEGRLATPSEQEILAKFNGWGTLADAFTENEKWEKEFDQLKELLTEEEYKAARAAMTNAFYTSPEIAKTMWAGLQRLGFNGGRILDPSMGSGIFFGTMPAEFSKQSELVGVELDSLTGRIAKQLYQNAAIDIMGFQERNMPNNYYDLAITNVPFADVNIYSDPEYKKQGYKLHDYFFAKSMDKVRVGGFVVFITSSGTMQSSNSAPLRKRMSSLSNLVAAYKLPNTAFNKNAGTQVTTDILILQKKQEKIDDDVKPAEYAQDWLNTEYIAVEDTKYQYRPLKLVNEYFKKYPQNMIGKPISNTLYGNDSDQVALDGTGIDVTKELSKLMQSLPENIYKPALTRQQAALQNTRRAIQDSKMGNFSFTEEKDGMYQRQGEELVKVSAKDVSTVKDYLKVMKALDNISNAQITPGTSEKKLADLRKTLNKNYDEFVKKHGYLNSPKNVQILGSDPNYGHTAAVEIYERNKKNNTESAEKADIFF